MKKANKILMSAAVLSAFSASLLLGAQDAKASIPTKNLGKPAIVSSVEVDLKKDLITYISKVDTVVKSKPVKSVSVKKVNFRKSKFSLEKLIALEKRFDESRGNTQQRYYSIVKPIAETYGVDPLLIMAKIKAESSFRANAVSNKGARKEMQLMPATAKEFNVKNIESTVENIDGGVRYFAYLLDRFDGNVEFATAAYNAGPNRVERCLEKYGRIPNISETKKHVAKVFNYYEQYCQKFAKIQVASNNDEEVEAPSEEVETQVVVASVKKNKIEKPLKVIRPKHTKIKQTPSITILASVDNSMIIKRAQELGSQYGLAPTHEKVISATSLYTSLKEMGSVSNSKYDSLMMNSIFKVLNSSDMEEHIRKAEDPFLKFANMALTSYELQKNVSKGSLKKFAQRIQTERGLSQKLAELANEKHTPKLKVLAANYSELRSTFINHYHRYRA